MVEYPVILAVQSPDPSLVLELIKRGADVNAMTLASRTILWGRYRSQVKGETVLDLSRSQITRLRKWKASTVTPPRLMYGMDEALSAFSTETWQHAVVKTAAVRAKRDNQNQLERYEREKASFAGLSDLQTQKAAIEKAILKVRVQFFERPSALGDNLVLDLLKLKYDEDRSHHFDQGMQKSLEFKPEFHFYGVNDLTEKRRAKHVKL